MGAADGEDDAREVAFFKPTTGCRLRVLDIEFSGSASTSSQAPSRAGGGGELVELGFRADSEGTEEVGEPDEDGFSLAVLGLG